MPHQEPSMKDRPRILVRPPADLPFAMVAGYLENCRAGLPEVQAAISRLDYDFIRFYGHRMKGCGAGYGFPALAETGARLEEAAHAHNDGALRECSAALAAHLESFAVVES